MIRRRRIQARVGRLEHRHLPDVEELERERVRRERVVDLLEPDPVARDLVERIDTRWAVVEPNLDATARELLETTQNPLLIDWGLCELYLELWGRMHPDPAYIDDDAEPNPWPPYGRWPD